MCLYKYKINLFRAKCRCLHYDHKPTFQVDSLFTTVKQAAQSTGRAARRSEGSYGATYLYLCKSVVKTATSYAAVAYLICEDSLFVSVHCVIGICVCDHALIGCRRALWSQKTQVLIMAGQTFHQEYTMHTSTVITDPKVYVDD